MLEHNKKILNFKKIFMLDIQRILWKPKIEYHKDQNGIEHFEVKYLPRWFGHSIWNAIRRVVLGYAMWWAVTALKIKGVSHEYTTIDGVKEHVIDIMLNFKKLRFKIDDSLDSINWIQQNFNKIGKVYAKDLNLPSGIEVLNPDVYLFEITDNNVNLLIDYRVEIGYGYYSIDFLRQREEEKESTDIWLLLIDNDFRLIEYIKYNVEELIEDFSGTMKDLLHIEIKPIADTISSKEILSYAATIISSYARLFIFEDAYVDKRFIVDYEDLEDKNEQQETANVKTVPIDALALSERTRNALVKNEILYIEDLEKLKKSDLLAMKGVWRKAVDEIISALASMGKSLAG